MSDQNTRTRCRLYRDSRFQDHRTASHPESHLRLQSVDQAAVRLLENCKTADNAPSPFLEDISLPKWPLGAGRDEFIPFLKTIHTPEYLHSLEQFAAHGGGHWDADTVVCPESFDVALLAASTAALAIEDVMHGRCSTGFVAGRPPGHHALPGAAMGFCLLGNVVVAAKWAQKHFDLRRILIVDWDVHHGNGTQDFVYEDENIWFYSIHRHPFYPGTGLAEETGAGAGLGTICNQPMTFGIKREAYLKYFESTLQAFSQKCQPELILISAGFDAHQKDPIGSLGLETEDFAALTKIVMQIAEQYCGGKIVSLLEGGYDLAALRDSVGVHLAVLSGLPEEQF